MKIVSVSLHYESGYVLFQNTMSHCQDHIVRVYGRNMLYSSEDYALWFIGSLDNL